MVLQIILCIFKIITVLCSYRFPEFSSGANMQASLRLRHSRFSDLMVGITQWIVGIFGGLRALTDIAIAGTMCSILYYQHRSDLTQRFVFASLMLTTSTNIYSGLPSFLQIHFVGQSPFKSRTDNRSPHKVRHGFLPITKSK
jgi:hypothetical protein